MTKKTEIDDLIIKIKKNISNEIIDKKKAQNYYCRIINWKNYKGQELYFPFVDERSIQIDNIKKEYRYGFDKSDRLLLVQEKVNTNEYVDLIYIQYNSLDMNCCDNNHEVTIKYDSYYSICEDERIRIYSSPLDTNSKHRKNKLKIKYDNEGNLEFVVHKSEKDVVFYQCFSKEEVERLKISIINKMVQYILDNSKKYSEQNGELAFIGLEHFYDGEAIDIGVRVGLDVERKELEAKYGIEYDVRNYGGDYKFYVSMLETEEIQYEADALFQYLKRQEEEGEEERVYTAVSDIIEEVTKKINMIEWKEIFNVSPDFIIIEPFQYD